MTADKYYNSTYGSKESYDHIVDTNEMIKMDKDSWFVVYAYNETDMASQTERMYTKEEVMDAIRMARQINYLNQDYEIMLSIKLK